MTQAKRKIGCLGWLGIACLWCLAMAILVSRHDRQPLLVDPPPPPPDPEARRREELVEGFIQATLHVRSLLKLPSSAEFPSALYSQDAIYLPMPGGKRLYTAWVDAKNPFGVTLRETWLVVMDHGTPRYCTIGELEYGDAALKAEIKEVLKARRAQLQGEPPPPK